MAREMKDSGIEWFGSIPVNWKKVAVKRLFEIGRGRVIATTELSDFGYPVYSSQTKNNGVLGYIDTYDYNRSQLTWTTDGANAGTVFLREGKHNCTNVCGTLMPILESANNLRYLKYIVSYTAFFHKRADINGYKIMNNEMAEIIIILPSQEEQNRIADFLDTQCAHIDSVIEKTRAAIEEYKRLKQSVITQAVTKGIRPNREMKDSGIEWIGEIPKEWVCVKFKYIAQVRANLVHPDDYGNYPQVSPENIEKGTGKILPCKTVKETGVISDNHLFYKGQILYSKIRPILNKVTIAPFDGLCSADMYPIETDINKYYLLYALLSDSYLVNIRLITEDRVKMPKINQEELSNIFFALPDKNEQSEIVAYLDEKTAAIDSIIQKKEQLITELEAYKKSLIYECVTGKKEVV